jgi:pilus assembly protein CpaE
MTKTAYSSEHAGQSGAGDQLGHDAAEDAPARALNERARPIPRISIQAFCESHTMADVVQQASEDRRLTKAHVTIQMGGTAAAVAHFQESPTPNLINLE